jgi:hypothetical protein
MSRYPSVELARLEEAARQRVLQRRRISIAAESLARLLAWMQLRDSNVAPIDSQKTGVSGRRLP